MESSHATGYFPRFVSVGEALTDLIKTDVDHWISKTGGATWNVARVVSVLGISSAFAGAISKDVFGDELWKASEIANLDLRFLQRVDKSPLLAIVHETQPPRYFFIGDDSADLYFAPLSLPDNWQEAVEWVHFGGISLVREPLAKRLVSLAGDLKSKGVRISYDPNFRELMDQTYNVTLRRMIEIADIVKVSDEDLAGLFRTTDIATAFSTLQSWNSNTTYLYTRGAAGASIHVGMQSQLFDQVIARHDRERQKIFFLTKR